MLFVWIVGIGYLSVTAVTTSSPRYALFDRYFIFALVPLMMLLAHERTARFRKPPCGGFSRPSMLTLAYGVFAVGATHDYLSGTERGGMRRAICSGGTFLLSTSTGVFEFNGWHGYDPNEPVKSVESLWVRGDRYMVAFGPVRGFRGTKV